MEQDKKVQKKELNPVIERSLRKGTMRVQWADGRGNKDSLSPSPVKSSTAKSS